MALRTWVSVDNPVALPAATGAQVLALSQFFPLTKGTIRALYVSGEFQADVGGGALIVFNARSNSRSTFPFLAIVFADAAGNLLDFVFLSTYLVPLSNAGLFVNDDSGVGAKIVQPYDGDKIWVSGRGGYPVGAVQLAIAAGGSVSNTDAVTPHTLTARIRAIVEEEGQEEMGRR